VIEPRLKKMVKLDPMSLQSMFDKTRDKEGNIRLGMVNKINKKNKKKQRKMGKNLIGISLNGCLQSAKLTT
jgi:predicted SPOUT superfamily RNA methylase MTH1